MKRHLVIAATTAVIAVTVLACSDAPVGPRVQDVQPTLVVQPPPACGAITTVSLVTAGGKVIGNVSAWNDATDLNVTFTVTRQNLSMRETHLQPVTSVGAIPLFPGGSPQMGQFRYLTGHNPAVQFYSYVVTLSSIGVATDDNIVLAAIALGDDRNGKPVRSWGQGSQIHPPNLPEYFNHVVQKCGP